MEVKAGDGATPSLNNLIKSDKYPDMKYGIKFGYKNIGFNGRFYTFLYFMAFMLRRFLSGETWQILSPAACGASALRGVY